MSARIPLGRNWGRSSFERLEGRRLLSVSGGNVTAAYDLATNTINIKGDHRSNTITIFQDVGEYFLFPDDGTTVNGSDTFVAVPTPGTANLKIDMGNGDDSLTIGFLEADNVSIATGNKADGVDIFFTTVHGDLSIDTGNSGDTVNLDSVDVDGNLLIDTGTSNDSVTFGGPVTVQGNSTVNGGNGVDALHGKDNLV